MSNNFDAATRNVTAVYNRGTQSYTLNYFDRDGVLISHLRGKADSPIADMAVAILAADGVEPF